MEMKFEGFNVNYIRILFNFNSNFYSVCSSRTEFSFKLGTILLGTRKLRKMLSVTAQHRRRQ